MSKSILDKHNYLKNIDLLRATIREYDMHEAGFSLIRENKLLPEEEILYLIGLTKLERTIEIGKLMKSNKNLAKNLMNSFIDIRHKFYEANNINEDNILSIKKDAVFTVNKVCKELKFGNYIEFKLKNRYSSFYHLNDIELYYDSRSNNLDVKGLGNLSNPLFDELKRIMKVNEIPKNNDLLFTLIKKLRSRYINLELDKECYRELNSSNNKFRLNETICGMSLYVDDIEDLNNVNIIYNYNKLILPFISILI